MDTGTICRKWVFILCSKFLLATKILNLKFELWLNQLQESCADPRVLQVLQVLLRFCSAQPHTQAHII